MPTLTSDQRRALVVDDSLIDKQVLERVLADEAVAVESVGDGLSAVAAVTRSTYDLIFIDMDMAGIDGLETAKAIRRAQGGRFDLKIAAISSSTNIGCDVIAYESGIDAVVRRPVAPRALARQVEVLFANVTTRPRAEVWRRSAYGRAIATLGHCEAQTGLVVLQVALRDAHERLLRRPTITTDHLPELIAIQGQADLFGFDELSTVITRIYESLFELNPRNHIDELIGAAIRCIAVVSDFFCELPRSAFFHHTGGLA